MKSDKRFAAFSDRDLAVARSRVVLTFEPAETAGDPVG
jgi:hypothetical protein